MIENLKFLNKTPLLKGVSGIVLILSGLYLLLLQSLLGVLFLLAGISLFVKNGTEINVDEKKYRDIYSIFGVVFGTWKPLPEIEYVSIFNAKL